MNGMTLEEEKEKILVEILAEYREKIDAIRSAHRNNVESVLQDVKRRTIALLKSALIES